MIKANCSISPFYRGVALLFILFLLLGLNTTIFSQDIIPLSPQEASQFIQDSGSDIIIIDLRSPQEWEEERIESAINYQSLKEESEKKNVFDSGKNYLFYALNNLDKSEIDTISKNNDITDLYQLNGGLAAWIEAGLPTIFFKTVKPSIALEVIEKNSDNPNFVIIDLRVQKDRITQRKIKNSIHIDYTNDDFLKELKKLDRTKTYLIHCKKGVRGEKTLSIMQENNFKRVYNIEGGFEGWRSKNMPTVR